MIFMRVGGLVSFALLVMHVDNFITSNYDNPMNKSLGDRDDE